MSILFLDSTHEKNKFLHYIIYGRLSAVDWNKCGALMSIYSAKMVGKTQNTKTTEPMVIVMKECV